MAAWIGSRFAVVTLLGHHINDPNQNVNWLLCLFFAVNPIPRPIPIFARLRVASVGIHLFASEIIFRIPLDIV